MSLVREFDAYKAYCNLCNYIGQKPMRKSKWLQKNNYHANQNKTIKEIQKEIDAIKEFA